MRDEDLAEILDAAGRGKILLVVLDGLGGFPRPSDGRTELEAAVTPHLDALARRAACGLHRPVGAGITPGSGPAHIGLFGYDPWRHRIGRGALSAAGVGFGLRAGDVAARANFCTLDGAGRILDRRAGRIPTALSAELCARIESGARRAGLAVFVKPEKDHRAAVIFRGEGLSDRLRDHDPQREGVAPEPVRPREDLAAASLTADLVNRFLECAHETLAEEERANGILLRGFAHPPDIVSFPRRYGLKAACVAAYPMYRGLSSLVGMELLEAGETLQTQLEALERHWKAFDFVFFHFKATDSAGEDGDFDRKVAAIEALDAVVPRFLALEPAALAITGDHSTPAVMRGHSWHPVPALVSSRWAFPDAACRLTERECARGMLGIFQASDLMTLLLAHAGRLKKYGA